MGKFSILDAYKPSEQETSIDANVNSSENNSQVSNTYANNSCEPGFEKDDKGNCVKIVKTNDVAGVDVPVTSEKNLASNGESNLEASSLESKKYTYADLVQSKNEKKKIKQFNKKYKVDESLLVKDVLENSEKDDKSLVIADKASQMYSYLIGENKLITDKLVPAAVLEIKEDLVIKKEDLSKKYDFNNPDQVLKAEQEFNEYLNKKLDSKLSEDPRYNDTLDIIKQEISNDLDIDIRKIQRAKLGLEDEETQGYASAFIETAKGFVSESIPIAFNNLQNMVESVPFARGQKLYENLQDFIKKEEVKLTDKIPENADEILGLDIDAGQVKRMVGENATYQDLVNHFEKGIGEIDESIKENFEDLDKYKWKQQWERQANIFDEDGLTGMDVATMAGKQILQMPLAFFTFGMSAALQETAGNYDANLQALARKEYGLKEGEQPTNDQLMRLMKEGKDDKIISTITGIASGALEYIGAKKALTATLFGKQMVSSFLRNGFTKQLGISALQTGAAAFESGGFEMITELGQTTLSQAGETIVGGKNAFNFNELIESGGQGLLIGTLFPLAGGASRQTLREFRTTAAKISAKYGNDIYSERLYEKMELGINKDFEEQQTEDWQNQNPGVTPMTEQSRRDKLFAIGQTRNASQKLPKSMKNVKDRQKAIELLVEQKELIEKNKGKAPELLDIQDLIRLTRIKDTLKQLAGRENLRTITIEDQNQMAEMIDALGDANAKAYDTTEEAKAAWDLAVDKAASDGTLSGLTNALDETTRAKEIQKIKNSFNNANANILYLKDGGEVIVLNNEGMVEGNDIDAIAANHEVLHIVLRRAIGQNKGDFKKIYQVLDPYLKQNLSANVYEAINDRFTKANEGEKSYLEQERFDEYLTVVGEQMKAGNIKYNKESEGFFKDLARIITDSFKRLFGNKPLPESFNFNVKNEDGSFNGKKVFDFLKDYQRAYKAGGQTAINFAKMVNNIELQDQQDSQSSSQSQKAESKSLYDKVDAIQEQVQDGSLTKSAAGFLVGELYFFEIEKRLEKGFMLEGVFTTPARWDGWSAAVQRDTIVDMQFGPRGIKNMVEKFDPAINNSLPAYINTYFNVRLTESMPNNLVAANVSIDSLNDSQQLSDEIQNDGSTTFSSKGRVLKSFNNFDLLTEDTVKLVEDKVIKTIQDLYNNNPSITPEAILDTIQKLIASEVRNIIKTSTGTVSLIKGEVTVSPEYKEFIDKLSSVAAEVLSVATIKLKYSRAKNAPFEIERIKGKKGKEKVKKVDPITKKTTYYEKGIFNIKYKGKGAFGSFFTSLNNKYTTLRERQNSITTEVANELVQLVINKFASNTKNLSKLTPDQNVNAVIGVKNVLNNIAYEIDKKLGEQKSFDSFRSSTKTIRTFPPEIQQAVARALRTSNANRFIEESDGKMINVIQRLFNGTSLLTPSQMEKVAADIQIVYDSVSGKTLKGEKIGDFNLNEFIANKIEDRLETNTYQDIFLALTGEKVSFDFNSKNDIIAARQMLNSLAKKYGKKFFRLYIAPGFVSPSKIGKGQWLADGLNNVIKNPDYIIVNEKGLGLERFELVPGSMILPDPRYSNDNRYGVIQNVEDLEVIMEGAQEGTIPKNLDYFAATGKNSLPTNLSTPPEAGKPRTDKQIAEIVVAGKFAKKAFDFLIKDLQKLGPAGTGAINNKQMLFFFKGNNASPKTLLRISATLGYMPEGDFNENEKMVLEHIIQAVTMNVIALEHVLSKEPSDAFDLTLKEYKTTYLPKTFDDIINKYYKETLPFYWTPGMTGMVRYYNLETVGYFTLQLKDLETGTIYGEGFAATLDYKRVDPYIKGKPSVSDRYNTVVANALDPNTSDQMTKAAKIRLNNAIKYVESYEQASQENVENLESSNIYSSSAKTTGQNLTIQETVDEAKKLDIIVEKNRKDYFEENYPYSSSTRSTMSDQFNTIIEESTGIGAEKSYSKARAMSEGRDKGKWAFIMDPSAEDFKGLLYSFIGKGKQGEQQLKFFNDTLFKPFAQAMASIDKAKQALSNDYNALMKQYPAIKQMLNKDSGYGNFSYDSAVRVYLFNKAGFEIPGLSKRDLEALVAIVEGDASLLAFSQDLSNITKQNEGYIKPGEFWLTGNIPSDLKDIIQRVGRKKYLETWIKNKNEIFTSENLNKIEALYGTDFRDALEDIMERMELGTNRLQGGPKNKVANNFMNWVNNSVGAIMFFNVRTAVLQTISAFNFINFTDNNIVKAGLAFANQEQYWADFVFLFNSDFLKQRRSGLQGDINAAELANAMSGKTNKAKAALNYLLTKGFLPTQIADSFAIASGGATFYRNRIATLIKEGMTQQQAEAEAMLQWRELSEEAQQSSRPDKISQQQAGPLGRVILAFANTPMQYTRLQKRAIQDLINGRGDWKENMGKVLYYGFVQNLIFNALQAALFAVLFDDEEDLDPKTGRIVNGMADSLLRGLGIYGGVLAAAKNVVVETIRQSNKSRPDYQNAALQALSLSPPISSKINKLRSAAKTWQYNSDDIMEQGLSLDNPAYLAISKIISATTNIPLDRLFMKIDNLRTATEQDTEAWQAIALALGWDQWSLGLNPYQIKGSRKRSGRLKQTSRSKSRGRTKQTQRSKNKL
tara:strand:+ start:2647 stop:10464 length:7818 start_codon:yes stop_codon:yes gene_type:complete